MARDLAGRYAPGQFAESPDGTLERDLDPDDGRTCTRCESESKEFDEYGVCYWCVAADRDSGEGPDEDNDDWDIDEDETGSAI